MKTNPWLSRYQARPSARLRLFCLPFAGGSASAYRGWPAALPTEIEVCPVQLPGREERFAEPAFRNFHDLIPLLADVLTPLLDLPFALYGHSMGSLLAFELAHELRSRGRKGPVALFPAAHQAPAVPHEASISELPDPGVIAHVQKIADMAKLLQHPKLLELMLPTLRSDLALCDTYVRAARPKLTCPITLFSGRDDDISQPALEAWGDETDGLFDIQIVPGGHLFLTSSAKDLLALLSRKLSALAY